VFTAYCGVIGAGSPGYTYLGCFRDVLQGSPYGDGGDRAFPVLLFSRWTVDQCAAAARDRGFPVFAIQFRHDCWLGTVADVAKMIAASQKTTDAACEPLPCAEGSATCPASLNKAYLLEGMPGHSKATQKVA
jgi:hypothetical protein